MVTPPLWSTPHWGERKGGVKAQRGGHKDYGSAKKKINIMVVQIVVAMWEGGGDGREGLGEGESTGMAVVFYFLRVGWRRNHEACDWVSERTSFSPPPWAWGRWGARSSTGN